MTIYLKITVTGLQVSGKVISLGAGEVDTFALEEFASKSIFENRLESGDSTAWNTSN